MVIVNIAAFVSANVVVVVNVVIVVSMGFAVVVVVVVKPVVQFPKSHELKYLIHGTL